MWSLSTCLLQWRVPNIKSGSKTNTGMSWEASMGDCSSSTKNLRVGGWWFFKLRGTKQPQIGQTGHQLTPFHLYIQNIKLVCESSHVSLGLEWENLVYTISIIKISYIFQTEGNTTTSERTNWASIKLVCDSTLWRFAAHNDWKLCGLQHAQFGHLLFVVCYSHQICSEVCSATSLGVCFAHFPLQHTSSALLNCYASATWRCAMPTSFLRVQWNLSKSGGKILIAIIVLICPSSSLPLL